MTRKISFELLQRGRENFTIDLNSTPDTAEIAEDLEGSSMVEKLLRRT